jgi:hypothetical protein
MQKYNINKFMSFPHKSLWSSVQLIMHKDNITRFSLANHEIEHNAMWFEYFQSLTI